MPIPVPTLEAEWKLYVAKVYTQGFGTPMQADQVRLAFFSGAMLTIKMLDEMAALPENVAVARLHRLALEAQLACVMLNEKMGAAKPAPPK